MERLAIFQLYDGLMVLLRDYMLGESYVRQLFEKEHNLTFNKREKGKGEGL